MSERATPPHPPSPGAGLCPRCAHVHVVVSDRGSTFYRCKLSVQDPRFPRFPPQPVLACPGFAR